MLVHLWNTITLKRLLWFQERPTKLAFERYITKYSSTSCLMDLKEGFYPRGRKAMLHGKTFNLNHKIPFMKLGRGYCLGCWSEKCLTLSVMYEDLYTSNKIEKTIQMFCFSLLVSKNLWLAYKKTGQKLMQKTGTEALDRLVSFLCVALGRTVSGNSLAFLRNR